jgi:hypothetical protein
VLRIFEQPCVVTNRCCAFHLLLMLLNLAIKEIVGKAFDLSVVSSESIVFWYNISAVLLQFHCF